VVANDFDDQGESPEYLAQGCRASLAHSPVGKIATLDGHKEPEQPQAISIL